MASRKSSICFQPASLLDTATCWKPRKAVEDSSSPRAKFLVLSHYLLNEERKEKYNTGSCWGNNFVLLRIWILATAERKDMLWRRLYKTDLTKLIRWRKLGQMADSWLQNACICTYPIAPVSLEKLSDPSNHREVISAFKQHCQNLNSDLCYSKFHVPSHMPCIAKDSLNLQSVHPH